MVWLSRNPESTTYPWSSNIFKSGLLYNVLNTSDTLKTINTGVRNDKLSDNDACESNHQDVSSSEVVPITDFKMFYVLQNNNTQLKCYDQLKVLANFAGFIKKIGSK